MFWDHQVAYTLHDMDDDLRRALMTYNKDALEASDVESMKWLFEADRGRWSWIVKFADPDASAIIDFIAGGGYDWDVDNYYREYEVVWYFEKLDDALMFKLIWC